MSGEDSVIYNSMFHYLLQLGNPHSFGMSATFKTTKPKKTFVSIFIYIYILWWPWIANHINKYHNAKTFYRLQWQLKNKKNI